MQLAFGSSTVLQGLLLRRWVLYICHFELGFIF